MKTIQVEEETHALIKELCALLGKEMEFIKPVAIHTAVHIATLRSMRRIQLKMPE